MINAKKEVIKEISEMLHDSIIIKDRQAGIAKDGIVLESRIFAILGENPDIQPAKCAIRLEQEYGYNITGEEVINIFRKRKMANPKERKELFEKAKAIIDAFSGAITGDKQAFSQFELLRKETGSNNKRHDSQDRICAIMIYQKFPEIVTDGDMKILEKLGNTLAKYFFYNISDAICEVYGFPTYRETKASEAINKKSKNKMTLEQATRRINTLESELERTSNMLLELQNEFDEQLSESKLKEMTDFFAKLNSEKYGCILDQLLDLRKGVDELRKTGYKIPIEINGLLIVIKKMIQFVQDNHIVPILKPDSTRLVRAADVEFSDYIGTPFSSEEEQKYVKTISPGWVFRDKEVQISRPRVKEVTE